MKLFYLIAMVVGTVIPWFYFAGFFDQEGLNLPLFVQNAFVNDVSSGATADLLISILVFWVWSYVDARQKGIKLWWLVIPAVLLVGLSLALPLYLYFRSEKETAQMVR
jgi:hypothetical protein